MKKRSLLLWLISLLLFFAGLTYLLQTIGAVRNWNMLTILQVRFGPLYPLFQGAFLAAAFLIGAVVLFTRQHWAPAYNAILLTLQTTWSWLDRLVFAINPQPIKSYIFQLIVWGLLLLILLGGLWVLEPDMLSSKEEVTSEFSSEGGNDEPRSS